MTNGATVRLPLPALPSAPASPQAAAGKSGARLTEVPIEVRAMGEAMADVATVLGAAMLESGTLPDAIRKAGGERRQ